jgi:transcriptional regulator with XRE-family HTH domain
LGLFSGPMTASVFSPRYRKLRQLLTEARTELGLSQAALAERLNRPQTFVSKYERGERRLDLVEFLEIADMLKADAHEILRQVQAVGRRR